MLGMKIKIKRRDIFMTKNFDIGKMINSLREHPEADKIGMIASHLGIVRGCSLHSKYKVKGINISFDKDVLNNIISYFKGQDGIVEVLVEVSDGLLNRGDAIMAVVVGGDIREHVFPTLTNMVNRIKSEASKKYEIFEE